MGYRKPENVVAPKSRWELGTIVCNTGQGGWSVAEGSWDDKPAVGIRWNGDDDSGSHGSPQSHGNPTWFIVPGELEEAIRDVAHNLNETQSFVSCKITKPDDFQYGVFQIHVEVTGTLRKTIANCAVAFEMPRLQNRFFRLDEGFRAPPGADQTQHRGQLKNGEWRCIVQTNGIEEEKNPTKMDVVQDTLVTNILRALKPYQPREVDNPSAKRVAI